MNLTFDESEDIILPLFNVPIQEYIELLDPKKSVEFYQLLLKYESRHSSYHGEMRSPRQKLHGNNSCRNCVEVPYL